MLRSIILFKMIVGVFLNHSVMRFLTSRMIFRIFPLSLTLSISSDGDTAQMDCWGFVNSMNLSVPRSRLLTRVKKFGGNLVDRDALWLFGRLFMTGCLRKQISEQKDFLFLLVVAFVTLLKKLVSIYSFIASLLTLFGTAWKMSFTPKSAKMVLWNLLPPLFNAAWVKKYLNSEFQVFSRCFNLLIWKFVMRQSFKIRLAQSLAYY